MANLIGVVDQNEVVRLAEHFASSITGGIDTAAGQVGTAGHPWIAEGQRWAVEAFFARLRALQGAMVLGGQA